MCTLRQRMADLTQAGQMIQGDVSGAWDRMYGGNYKTCDNANLEKADINYYGFQLGVDVNTAHYSDNTNYLGMFLGHTTGKPDYYRGNATATAWYSGFYDIFIADDGFYVDSAMKLGQYRNKYNLKDSQDNALNGKAQSCVITLSSQAGKPLS
jgi:outer membrane autotransporter protein